MPAVFISLLLAGIVLLVVWVARRSAAEIELVRQTWRAFAASRGLEWSQPDGTWYRRTSDLVAGNFEGVPIRLDTYVVSTGKTTIPFTRVTTVLERPMPSPVTVSRRHFFTGVGETLGRKTVRTGDASFDARMAVRSKDAGVVRSLLDATVRARILETPRPVTVQLRDRSAKVTWRGREQDPAALDAGLRIGAALARAGG